ncbi:MAG TPA: hypothetical protein VHR66_05360 [Gemmataceae bacterium]|jgi:MFS family permease|nr:hypothetical protein [Gemmataceae bacterium]
MLWAQFQPKNQPQADAMLAGAACMGVACAVLVAAAGIIVGVVLKQKPRATAQPYIAFAIAAIGAPISGVVGFLFGCIGGIPISLLFIVPIVIMLATVPSGPKRRRRSEHYDDDYDDDYDDNPRRRRLDEEDDDDYPRRRRRDPDDY